MGRVQPDLAVVGHGEGEHGTGGEGGGGGGRPDRGGIEGGATGGLKAEKRCSAKPTSWNNKSFCLKVLCKVYRSNECMSMKLSAVPGSRPS